jgi:hypothetical protein
MLVYLRHATILYWRMQQVLLLRGSGGHQKVIDADAVGVGAGARWYELLAASG